LFFVFTSNYIFLLAKHFQKESKKLLIWNGVNEAVKNFCPSVETTKGSRGPIGSSNPLHSM
jgi:hypothetical protein